MRRRGLRRIRIGKSVNGEPIWAYQQSGPPACVMLLGGVHGDEPKSVYVVRCWIDEWVRHDNGLASWVIIPVVNPDGLALRTRRNIRKVDINRNFPTEDWAQTSPRGRMYGGPRPLSEPETRAVVRAVDRWSPQLIISVHSISNERQCVNYDGPAKRYALAMAKRNGYPVTGSIGYPTPGSFGSWAGMQRRIPVITLELPSRCSRERCWRDNADALAVVSQIVGNAR